MLPSTVDDTIILQHVHHLGADALATRILLADNGREAPLEAGTILELLVQAHPDIVLRETIENAVWPEARPVSEAALRGHVHRLRQLLAEVGGESLIRTVRGVGYRLNDAI